MTIAGTTLDRLAIDTIRTLSIDGVQQANSGHPGAPMGAAPMAYILWTRFLRHEIGRAGQQECRARDLHSFPTRRSSDLDALHRRGAASELGPSRRAHGCSPDGLHPVDQVPAARDRKSGSAGMPSPRSTLFPYTPLFRSGRSPSTGCSKRTRAIPARPWVQPRWPTSCGPGSCGTRSEERVSRNAEPEIYTLSLHAALPIWTLSIDGVQQANSGHPGAPMGAAPMAYILWTRFLRHEIGRAGQQECRARDLHSFPTRRSSDLDALHRRGAASELGPSRRAHGCSPDGLHPVDQVPAARDRKSGSAGMPSPRSTLFPYTPLFRSGRSPSTGCSKRTRAIPARPWVQPRWPTSCGPGSCGT